MRKILLTIGLPLSLLAVVSCADHAKQESGITQEVESVEVKAADAEKGTTVEQAEPDTWNIPSSSSNGKQISFNGIIMMPPKSHSIVTLTMGGALESLPVFTGDYVKKGQIIATLRNPDFIQLQQEYLTASAQVEYLEKEYPNTIMRLEVEEENTRAIAVYRKNGYETLPYMEMKKEI